LNQFKYFLHIALVGFLLQITNILSYWTSFELALPCNISQWRKWRVAVTSYVPQRVIDKAVDQWRTRLHMDVLKPKPIILNISYRPVLISVII